MKVLEEKIYLVYRPDFGWYLVQAFFASSFLNLSIDPIKRKLFFGPEIDEIKPS